MENIIKVLPESVANQIAAGEVVQRPASAVKELMENAIDAGSSKVTLNIKEAGKSLIQVIDNGAGMSEIDLRLCVERHATSKIGKIEDLFHVRTMGFRGEAMASITAVSQSEIRSKENDAELASVLKMEGSKIVSQDSETGSSGTSVAVKNLFFNVPARRNFLKSNSVENRHIMDTFQQIALGNPSIAFVYINNGEELYHLDKSNFKQRIVQLFGKRFNERLVPVQEETDIVKIDGFVGKPEFATLKRGEQFFLVNNRYIKSPYLHHAVMAAFEDLLPKDSHPQYFIRMEIDPEKIDVNIHPTKTEIKFMEERSIYAILRTSIRQSLGKFNISPSLDFERETAFDDVRIDKSSSISMPQIQVDKSYDPFKPKSSAIQPSKEFAKQDPSRGLDLYDVPLPKEQEEAKIQLETRLSDLEEEETAERKDIIQLHNRFILTHIKTGFMIIDQHRAHQKILLEKLIADKKGRMASQKLLFPVLVELGDREFELVKEIRSDLEKIGFSIEEFGKDSLSINGIPPGLKEQEVKDVFLKILADYHESGMKKDENTYDKLSVILASNMAIKGGQKLHLKEMESIIDQLFACEMPHSLPNGKPIIVTLSLDELKKKFLY